MKSLNTSRAHAQKAKAEKNETQEIDTKIPTVKFSVALPGAYQTTTNLMPFGMESTEQFGR